MDYPNIKLRCTVCGSVFAPYVHMTLCPSCDGVLDIEYISYPSKGTPLLPLALPDKRLILGEGNTPLLALSKIAELLGIEQVWSKVESIQPTGSFKDRGAAIMISAAKEQGITAFVEDSSGNAAASAAAYAAAAGMDAHLFVPESASAGKLDQIRIFGATLHTIPGKRQAATESARAFATEKGIPYLSHAINPFFIEGMKSIAYEIVDAGKIPCHIVLPAGNGSLIIGIHKGLEELLKSGINFNRPRIHCIQSKAVRPISAAVLGEEWDPANAKPTVASGIAVSRPPNLRRIVQIIRQTGGKAIDVDDASILKWRNRLAETEGIFCEPTAAVPLAGLADLISQGAISPHESVLILITGSGLKEPLC